MNKFLFKYINIIIYILFCLILVILLLLSFKSLIKISSNLLIMFAVITMMYILLNLEVLKLFPLIQSLYTLKVLKSIVNKIKQIWTRRVLPGKYFLFIIHKKLEKKNKIQHFIEENTNKIVYKYYITHDTFKY